MALSKIDVANMLTGATPVANGGTALTSGFKNGVDPRPDSKPLIINGDMMVAQRGTSTASITGSDVFVVDRWRFDEGADATVTMSQETLSSGDAYNNGFKKSLKVLFTTGDNSLGTTQSEQLIQHIEAQDCQLLKYGTANAVDLTLAFWYKSNVTGTHVVTLDKPDSTRTTCPVEFTVSSADTWEFKVLNFNANDTIKGSSGAIANDNGTGLRVMWNLAYGSSYLSGTNGTWTQGGTGHFSTSNQQNIAASNNNYVELTGVQLEVGQFTSTTLPPFQHESFGQNYHRCCRYFFRRGEISRLGYGCVSGHASNLAYGAQVYYPTIMRATPTQSHTDTSGFYFTGGGQNQTLVSSGTIANEGISKFGVTVGGQASGSLGIGNAYWFNTENSSAYIQWDAEL